MSVYLSHYLSRRLLFLFMPGFLLFGWRRSGFGGQGVSQMISETVYSFPIHRLPSQVGYGEWYLHWWRLPLLLLARQSGLPEPRGPPFRLSAAATGLRVISPVSRQLCQSETPWVAPMRSSQHAARPHSLSALCLMATQTLSLLFFHHRVEFFHFSLLVLILSPCFILSGLS